MTYRALRLFLGMRVGLTDWQRPVQRRTRQPPSNTSRAGFGRLRVHAPG